MSTDGVALNPSKISAMLEWPTPKNTIYLRGFLGLIGFYRSFICRYAIMVAPLTNLLRKDQFSWTVESQRVFDQLKQIMTQAPVLTPPDFFIPFLLEADASDVAMGVVLTQRAHPIAFYSKVFCPRLQQPSTYVWELHTITSILCNGVTISWVTTSSSLLTIKVSKSS